MNSSEILDRLQAALPVPDGMTNRAWLDAHESDVMVLVAEKGQTVTEDLLGFKRSTIYSWKHYKQDAKQAPKDTVAAAEGGGKHAHELQSTENGETEKVGKIWPPIPCITPPSEPTQDFTITGSDLRWLNDQEFHQVWEAMGMVVRARFRR